MNKSKFFSKAAALLHAPSENDHDLLLRNPYHSESFRLGRGEISVITSSERPLIYNVVTSIINATSLEAKTPIALITWHMDGLGWLTRGYRDKFSKNDNFLELTSNEQFFEYYRIFIEALNSDILTIYDDYYSDLFEVFHCCIRAKAANKALRFIIIDDVAELNTARLLSHKELTALFKDLARALDASIIFLVSFFNAKQEIDLDNEQSLKLALCQKGWDVNKLEWLASISYENQDALDVSWDFLVTLFRPGRITTMSISQPRKDNNLSTCEDSASVDSISVDSASEDSDNLSEQCDKFDNDLLSFLELHRKAWSDLKISDIQRLFKLSYSRSQRIFDALTKEDATMRDHA